MSNLLSGYDPRIVKENVELLRFVNEEIEGLDKELRKIAKEDLQAKRLMTLIGVGPNDCSSSELLGGRYWSICQCQEAD